MLNVTEPAEARVCVPADGDHVAVIGENRKMLVFPLAEVPEMTRGKGVSLQRYKDGGLSDARVFKKADGLTWLDPRRPHLHAAVGGAEGLGRRPRAVRAPRAQGLPALK